MKTDISFRQGSAWPASSLFGESRTEWMVELQSLKHPETTVVEIVTAHCFDEAVYNAFFTRNIASSWKVTEVEEVA